MRTHNARMLMVLGATLASVAALRADDGGGDGGADGGGAGATAAAGGSSDGAAASSSSKSKAPAIPDAVAYFDVTGTDAVYDQYGETQTSDVVRIQPASAAGSYPKSATGLVFPGGVFELHMPRGAARRLPTGTRLAIRLPLSVVEVGAAYDDGDGNGGQ